MSPFLSIGIYLALVAVVFFLTYLCLRNWKRFAAGKDHGFWVIPGALLALLPVVGTLLPDSPAKFALQAAGNIWLGFFLYYGFLLVVLLAVLGLLRRVHGGRNLQRCQIGALCLSLAVSMVLLGYGLVHAQNSRVVSYDLNIEKPVEETRTLKLVLIADLHLSVNSRLDTAQRMVTLINAQQPDAVVIAGDIFTSSYASLAHPEQYAAVLRGIESKYGVYAVYGNHDVEETLFGGFPISPISQAFRTREMEQFFDDCGFITLADEVVTLGDSVQLAGRVDGQKAGDGTADRLSPAALLADVDQSLPVLVLQHEPKEFEALKAAGADVALCGHTHAGQLFPGNLIVPFFNENAWGHKQVHGLETFVTAGVGYYGPPIRVGTNSEITVINMTFSKESAS